MFKQAITLDPNFGDAWAGLADATSKAASNYGTYPIEYLDSALKYAEKAVTLAPLSAASWKAWGTVYSSLAQYDKASEKYEKALELDPNHSPAINNLAMAKLAHGDYPGSIQLFRKLIDLNPVNSHAYSNIANRYLTMNMFKEVKLNVDKALFYTPNDWHTHSVLSKLYLWKRDTSKCIEHARKLVEQGTDNPYFMELAAFILRDISPDLSDMYFDSALKTPNFDPAYYMNTEMYDIRRKLNNGDVENANQKINFLRNHATSKIESGALLIEYFLTLAYLELAHNNTDKALNWIEGIPQKNLYYDIPIRSDPWLKPIAKHPRFIAVMEQIEQSKQQMRFEISAQETSHFK